MDPKLIIDHTERSLARADQGIASLIEDIQSAVASWTPDRVYSHLGGPINVASRISELAVATARRDELRDQLELLRVAYTPKEA